MTRPQRARHGPGGEQSVEILVDRGYSPRAIVARAGEPLRIAFRRRDPDDPTDRVVFSSPHLDRRLERGSVTTVVLPARPPGEVRFTCGMGRYHGSILFRAEQPTPLAPVRRAVQRLRARAAASAHPSDMGDTVMTAGQPTGTTRAQRRAEELGRRRLERRRMGPAGERDARHRRERLRAAGFGLVVVAVLGAGAYLAFGDLLGQRGSATTAAALPVRLSMAGFTPAEIRVPAGETVALELWTTDAAPHLENGVHTMISDELGFHEELAAAGPTGESRRVVELTMPAAPGRYDIYCDTCCGGKASPTMHGTLVVEA